MFVNEQIGVFVNSETVRFHFNQIETVNQSLKFNFHLFFRDVDSFLNSSHQYKIATYHVPFALGPDWEAWIEQFNKTYNHCDHTFIFCSELHEKTIRQLVLLDLPNVSLYISGVINHHEFKNAKVYQWMDWFHTSSEFYTRTNPGFLDDKFNDSSKPKAFDILLGNQRPHRDFVYDYIKSNDLSDREIMTYVYYSHKSLIDNDQFIFETDNVVFDPERTYNHSVASVKYHGVWITLSQIVPLQIYNQTAYSLVAETNFFNEFNFYTEKIVKPLLAKRLFVVISGKHYLKNLRDMGFQTFGEVLDESYDSIEDNVERWTAAMNEVKRLSLMDQESILEKIKPIVDHNYRLIAEKNWYSEMLTKLSSEVSDFLQTRQIQN